MALFDKVLPQAQGNLLGAATSKIQESATKVVSGFGGSGPFTKVVSGSSRIDVGAAETTRVIAQAQRAGADPNAVLGSLAAESIGGSSTFNALTTAAAGASSTATEAQASASVLRAAQTQEQDRTHLVRLVEKGSAEVAFEVMPEVTESRSVEYEAVAPPQAPAAFQKYRGTSSTQWTVNATLTCRTTDEATENLRILNQLRGWTKPYFGENTRLDFPTKLGAPPPVLEFSGFRRQMIGPVPVVITSLNWSFPQDVDYIPAEEVARRDSDSDVTPIKTGRLIPFPTVMRVAIQLVETFSTEQFNGFSLADFRLGQFTTAWAPLPGQGTNLRIGRSPSAQQAPLPQEAQVVLPSALRGGNGFVPDLRAESGRLAASASSAIGITVGASAPVRGVSQVLGTYGVPITERVQAPFKSGSGGIFGGGGASGDF